MTKMRWNCEERQECYLEERWDCESVGQAFEQRYGFPPFLYGNHGNSCSPTDIDAVVLGGLKGRLVAAIERNDNLVVIENKHVNEKLPDGQRILLEALCRRGIPVLLQACRDNAADEVAWIQWWHSEDGIKVIKEKRIVCGRLVRDLHLHRWFKRAGQQRNRGVLGAPQPELVAA